MADPLTKEQLEALNALATEQFMEIWNVVFKVHPTRDDLQELKALMPDFAKTLDLVSKELLNPSRGTDPTDPPIDPPPPVDPPVYDGYGPDPDVDLVDWLWKAVDGAGKKDIPELPDHFLPGTEEKPNIYGGFSLHTSYKGDYGGGLKSENFNDYDDFITYQHFEVYWYNKWGSRQYGTRRDNYFLNGWFHDGVQEHALYHNICGWGMKPEWGEPRDGVCLVIDRCLFTNIPGQCVQFVQRTDPKSWHETWDPTKDFTYGGRIIVQNSYLERVGIWDESERASFALSFFETLNDVEVHNVILDNTSMPDHCRGSLLCERREKFTMDGCDFKVGKLWQPFMKIENVDDVVIDGSYFEAMGGQNQFEFEGCKNVTITNCQGNGTKIFWDTDTKKEPGKYILLNNNGGNHQWVDGVYQG